MKNNIKKTVANILMLASAMFSCAIAFAEAPPPVNISTMPLFSGRGNVHPNLILDLSVEFPTVGAAYRAEYDKSKEYLGYFNPEKCYAYANDYFSISKNASASHECGGDSFSGNFMNWASASAIDMLRYALTGGDRVVDTVGQTVLQRAYLPDGSWNSNANFYAHGSYFPRKFITNARTVTPFEINDSTTIEIVSYRNRIRFGTSRDADKFGDMLVRVEVCGNNEGPTRTDLCSRYGSNYKPEGNLQRYADKIRAGAFGYLTGTHIDNLYGGVLRAPAKYVGQRKFVPPGFGQVENDQPEWHPETGVFYSNPIGDGSGSSGVINYLNKFGRTNISRLGAYKTKDPVAEMYYESLRYLQGKQPTSGGSNQTSATRALGGASTDDNFPVYKSWNDPITASCQSNYVVVIGDVNTHQDGYVPGSDAKGADASRTADVAGTTWPALDVGSWSSKISQMETGSAYGNLAPRSNLTGLDTTTKAGANNGTYNMAGLAYWANTNDIRFDKPTRVRTFAIDVDELGNGSKEDNNIRPGGTNNYRKPRNSSFYLTAKYGGFLDKGDSTSADADRQPDGNPFWTFDSEGEAVNNNAEWTGTPDGTDPSNYFLASQPEKLISAIHNIFQVVSSNSGTISGVTLTSTRVATDNAYVYQPGFDPSKWSGSLLKLKLSYNADTGTVDIQDASDPVWDAGLVLTGKTGVSANPVPAARKIYTSKAAADGNGFETVEFVWGNLTAAQQTALSTDPVTGEPDTDETGQKRVDFLRGGRSDEVGFENGVFRSRDRVLGDIINSNPTWIGPPAAYVTGEGYADFYADHKNRTGVVYVGANDGMLHAFKAETGVEVFAYVPDAVMPALNQLSDPAYAHRPYVDGQMTVQEAKVNGNWKTVLASGMGGGAQGVFALDVTNPVSFAAGAGALWEFTDQHDGDMGNLMGSPVIAKFRVEGSGGGLPKYKHFVVVAGGLNNYLDDGNKSDTGNGALFLLSLDKSASQPWKEGVNYYKYTTPIKETSMANGLGTPGLVTGNDGAVRFAYAGDLQGNLWRFDFSGNAPWKGAVDTMPVFTAKDAAGQRQPITQEPKVIFAPGGGYVVLFGTGKFVDHADVVAPDFQTQSFYAIYDTTEDAVTGRDKLAKRMLSLTGSGGSDAFTVKGDVFSYGVPAESDSAVRMGWYLDFPGSGTGDAAACTEDLSKCGTGERSVTTALVTQGKLFFNSLITGNNPCEAGGGRTYAFCALSGFPFDEDGQCLSDGTGVTGFLSEVGMLSTPVLLDVNTAIAARDSLGQRAATRRYAIVNFGTGGKAGTASAAKDADGNDFTGLFYPAAGRISWREVLNYDELRKAAGH